MSRLILTTAAVAAALTAVMLATLPARAQGMDSLLPRLTFPTDATTVSTKGCQTATTPTATAPTCILQE